ncbi:MAG: hypothetical protein H8D82_01405 [Euryarchaeota archaeon]|nr:hypothetical protein [Euryarchaeota archaeon]
MTYSEDGQFWWNGSEWLPANQAPQTVQSTQAPQTQVISAATTTGDPRYSNNELEVKQRIRSLFKFGQQYDIYTPGTEQPQGYAHRGFNLPFLPVDLVIYSDQSQQQELLRAKQINGFDGWGTFEIMDSITGEHIATFKNHFWAGIFQRKWSVTDPSGNPLFMIQEDSLLKSLLRRFGGGAIPLINVILRTNMNFRTMDGSTDFGAFNRKFSLRDRYQLQRSSDQLDGRLLWITGPLLDNAGGR